MSTFQSADPDDSRFDDRLRALYDAAGEEAAAPPPGPGGWAGVEARLRPGGPRAGRPLAAGILGLLVGGLLMGWWNEAGERSAPATSDRATTSRTDELAIANSAPRRVASSASATASADAAFSSMIPGNASVSGPGAKTAPVGLASSPTQLLASATGPVRMLLPGGAGAPAGPSAPSSASTPSAPAQSAAPQATAPAGPATGSTTNLTPVQIQPAFDPVLPAVLASLLQGSAGFTADSSRETRRVALRAARAALTVLTHRADSLLLALGEPALAATPAVTAADSLSPAAPMRRWSVVLAGAPEWSFLSLQAPAADTATALRRTHEQGRAGWNAAVLAEYRLSSRWSAAVGVGLGTTGAELRLTDRRTVMGVRYDTATTHSQTTDQITTTAYAVQMVPEPRLTPRYNLSGQVLGFDTVWRTRPDTTWTVLTSTRETNSTDRTVTPVLSRREETSARVLRPSYRFLTTPLLVRYRLGRAQDWTGSPTAPRWWADVAVGAQLQWFLGGTQLVTADGGRTFNAERIGANSTAFRPLSVAVLGQVAVNYALSPRLSANLAPTVRWQAQSVYRAGTGLTQKPATTGVQLGVRYNF